MFAPHLSFEAWPDVGQERPMIRAAFVLLVSALFAVLPIASKIVDYGAEGWLWALFGLYQRMYVDGRSATDVGGAPPISAPSRAGDDREREPNAPPGLLCRRGRLHLAGTKGILVSSDPLRGLHSWRRRFVR
jgi:hypothetical protein